MRDLRACVGGGLACSSPRIGLLLVLLAVLAGCALESGAPQAAGADDVWAIRRRHMVEWQLEARDIRDRRVLEAMRRVPRHLFVPAPVQAYAYEDRPLPIGYEQTISQPYIVAYMTQALRLPPDSKTRSRVLEIGTGSGYQAAVLGELCHEVYTIEIVPELADQARAALKATGYTNVFVRSGDGYLGWPERAPFDGILVTAAPDHVPQPLVDQLAAAARMIIPIGRRMQQMTIVTKTRDGARREETIPVLFVPMTGKAIEK